MLLIQTLQTFWAERIWILKILIFGIFWAPSPDHTRPKTARTQEGGPSWGPFPTFWAERIWILRIFIFWIFWAPNLGPGLGPGLGLALGPDAGAAAGAAACAAPDEFSDPNLTPLPTHPGIKYVARTLAATEAFRRF